MDIMTQALSSACLPRVWTDEEKEQLCLWWAEGHSQTEIGRRLGGLSKTAVKNQVARMGLPRRVSAVGPRLSDEERAARQRPERNDPLALLKRQATLPLPQPMPTAAPTQCQWALNDGRPWRFCNRTTVYHHRLDGSRYRSSWCAQHIERVFACRSVEAAA